jgi:EAL domain-containing protein (putative c-di-GMP-specific phosphodiesterase class I)
MGVSFYPDNGVSFESLIKQADMAMYSAKSNGRNKFDFFMDDMASSMLCKVQINSELKYALNNGEFRVVYQPIINLKSKQIIGAEALLRWKNPSLGDVSPEIFIPIAEETSLIIDIGNWVMEEAIKQNKKWHKLGADKMKVAVNFSARQFCCKDIIPNIQKLLNKHQLPPHFFEVELTETLLIQDQSMVIKVLQNLKSLGISLSIDDYGTGYSSLEYLKNFPVDKLKIDKSFISTLSKDNNDSRIVIAVLAIANSFNLQVIAEGIETDYQQKILVNNNCDYGQGYFYSKPCSAEEFTTMLKRQK